MTFNDLPMMLKFAACRIYTPRLTALAMAVAHLLYLCHYVSCLLTELMMFLIITIYVLDLVFILISSSCDPTGTDVPSHIVG